MRSPDPTRSAPADPPAGEPLAPPTLRLVIADDNPVVRTGMANVLATLDGLEVVGCAADGREALRLVQTLRPDLALLDVRMPEVDGIAVAQAVAASVPVLMLTHSDQPEVIAAALAAGARGYVVHSEFDVAEIAHAIRTVASGGVHLSPAAGAILTEAAARAALGGPGNCVGGGWAGAAHPDPAPDPWGLSVREREVMDLIARGMTNGQIAKHCFLSEKTVKNHVNRIFAKLTATSRAEAVSRWLRR
jgi:DNA-binding NarL/FixJ family response regulator